MISRREMIDALVGGVALAFEYPAAGGKIERIPGLASELAHRRLVRADEAIE